MKKHLSYYLGNTLIVLSFLGFLYISYPVLTAYLFPSPPPTESMKSFAIWIPKIKAAGEIISEVDPWDKNSYQNALRFGIAHARGFAYPGEKGAIFLFAHSSGPPWEQTRYNSVFLRLGELEKGDSITIWRNGKEYQYTVTTKKVVLPQEVTAVTKVTGNQLIIQTCTPIGTDYKRLLVFATEKRI